MVAQYIDENYAFGPVPFGFDVFFDNVLVDWHWSFSFGTTQNDDDLILKTFFPQNIPSLVNARTHYTVGEFTLMNDGLAERDERFFIKIQGIITFDPVAWNGRPLEKFLIEYEVIVRDDDVGPLFTSNRETINFTLLTDAQAISIERLETTSRLSAMYDALGGDDQIILPNGAVSVGTHVIPWDFEEFFSAGFGNDRVTGGNRADKIDGGSGIDALYGGLGNDFLDGGLGNDFLDGGLGNDRMIGDAGNDTFIVNSAGDELFETLGVDLVKSTVTRTLAAGFENLTLLGAAGINGTGNAAVNTIRGNGGNNILNGGLGNDVLAGGAGNDTYVINSIGDTLFDSAGIDLVQSTISKTLAAGFENLTLLGGAAIEGIGNTVANFMTGNAGSNKLSGLTGNDTLNGSAGNDTLNGSAGIDRLTGGLGKDNLTGGAGFDDFDFNTVAEIGLGAARDVIRDFTAGDDIDLFTIDGNGAATGNAFTFLAGEGAAFTGVAGQLRFRHLDAAGTANYITIVEGDVNGNRAADFQLQVNGLKNFTAGDFVL